MAFWSLVTYTRPDTSKEFYIRKSEAEVLATPLGEKVSEYMNTDPKKIIHYERKLSEDNLTQYFKVGFKDEATYNEFTALTDFSNSRTEQAAWCSANSLTYELITGTEEPII